MRCSLRGLVTNAAKDEMESSSCSLVTTPSLMLLTTSQVYRWLMDREFDVSLNLTISI